MSTHRLYEIALTQIKGVGDITARQLLAACGSAEAIFKEKKQLLEKIPRIGSTITNEIFRADVLSRATEELNFVEKNKIQTYFINDAAYPKRLKECEDAPMLLYYKGNGALERKRIISIVGTRKITPYGVDLTEQLLKGLSEALPELLVVSGLAYGVDIAAHRSALKNNLDTVAVLAHGLDRIYPAVHRNTAVEMLENGGLLTDFPSQTTPDKQNFIKRNRIVAGLSDATIVIESAEKGGSLITSDIAFSYGRDVYAFPGRTNDAASKGCNDLIRQNKAGLITSADDLIMALCWDLEEKKKEAVQTTLYFDLTAEQQQVMALIETEDQRIDELAELLKLPIHELSATLFDLEMRGMIKNMPGGVYRMV